MLTAEANYEPVPHVVVFVGSVFIVFLTAFVNYQVVLKRRAVVISHVKVHFD